MASVVPDEILPSPGAASPVTPTSTSGQVPLEQAPRLKGRQRLLQSLQRMSSTPSLVRRTRSHSTGYQRDGKASLSCVSLSPQCWADPSMSSPSQIYGGLGTSSPPATTAPSPGSARIRTIGSSQNVSQATVPLPADVRPASRSMLRETYDPETELINEMNGMDVQVASPEAKSTFDFWQDMPDEIKMGIFNYLTPKEIVRCSLVSRAWYKFCFDGQLWSRIDTSDFYSQISSDALLKIIKTAGPFIRDLNLRGCVQLRDKWLSDAENISDTCRNVVNFSLEGCRIDKTAIHYFLLRNPRLRYINLSGLSSVTNSAMKIIAQSCPQLDTLNVSWCSNVDTKGLKRVVEACTKLRDLRAGEISGFDDEDMLQLLFERNALERLVIHRTDVDDGSLKVLMHGKDPEIDILTDRPIVPPRVLKHLDLHQCANLTDQGLQSLTHNVPFLEGLQVSQCPELTDDAITDVLRTTPKLTHLELEDLDKITNSLLIELAKTPCAERLEHLNVSYCESLGDFGMLAILKSCPQLKSVEMDNTRISDLSLIEASYLVRKRGYSTDLPCVGLRLVAFDCVNVTWAGVREVLSSNSYLPQALKAASAVVTVKESNGESDVSDSLSACPPTPSFPPQQYPKQIIQLKCFYGWQMTVDEHTKRVLRGSLKPANNLARKWADYMMATEEAGTGGAGARRRRRRARDAERLYNFDEDDDDSYGPFIGRRRRARSGGCTVM
ncbi:F-box domain protein [Talaromyces proteolyticus]|uniref:F-box domain protein n=1 Tax=Talaromyces proteolyticus TaxID=1131652 RepID=A0AAD4KMZ9_9EURO|nr:F-box domain protein [Talaromyces proteolyticus]KAH8692890.1 F-box domain protein [Talaromyces proteolyticus]